MASAIDHSGAPLERLTPTARELGMDPQRLRRLADSGVVPFTRTRGGHRRFDIEAARAALARRENARRRVEPIRTADWYITLPLPGLQEQDVWRAAAAALPITPAEPAFGILQRSFLEMLNNAIEHSDGSSVEASLWKPETPDGNFTFRIADDGIGAFERMRLALGVDDAKLTVLELTKGKFTSAPEGHSGEGIFFTSKALDSFRLEANGLAFERDSLRDDYALGMSPLVVGTTVEGSISATTTRTVGEVFAPFTKSEGFDVTRPSVRLALAGEGFVSRGEARRVMSRLDQFDEVEVDFAGVDEVGQGFVDEVFRVWTEAHPAVTLTPLNMNTAVEFMVRRGIAERDRRAHTRGDASSSP